MPQESLRRSIFEQNLLHIEKHNEEASQGMHSYTLGINQFADMTQDEFVTSRISTTRPLKLEKIEGRQETPVASQCKLPSSIDWREKVGV